MRRGKYLFRDKLVATGLVAMLLLGSFSSRPAQANLMSGLGDGLGVGFSAGVALPDETAEDKRAKRVCEDRPPTDTMLNPCPASDTKEKAAKLEAFVSTIYAMSATVCAAACSSVWIPGVGAATDQSCSFMTQYVGPGADLVTKFTLAEDIAAQTQVAVGAAANYGISKAVDSGAREALEFFKVDLENKELAGKTSAAFENQSTAVDNLTAAENELKLAQESGDPARIEAAQSKVDQATKNLAEQNNSAMDASTNEIRETERDNAKVACVKMAFNLAQTAVRGYNAQKMIQSAREERRGVLEIVDADAANRVHSPERAQNTPNLTNPAGGASPDRVLANTHAPRDKFDCSTGDACAQSAASAGFGPILDKFQEVTKRPPAEVFDKVFSGTPPIQAAAEAASGTLGDKGLKLMAATSQAMDPELKNVATQQDVELAKLAAKGGYEAAGTGRSAKAKSGFEMPDFGKLLSGMLPGQKQKKNQPQGRPGLYFNVAGGTPASNQGLHKPDRSIFEVVGARYQLVVPRFFAGTQLVPEGSPADLLPTNPYLKTDPARRPAGQ